MTVQIRHFSSGEAHGVRHRRQQMAGQFHLADHFDLRVERRVPGMCLAGEGCIVLWCIRCAPEHTIDGQQGQAAPVRMRRGVMPELRCFREHAADSLNSQTLAGLNNGTGATKGRLPGSMMSRRFTIW